MFYFINFHKELKKVYKYNYNIQKADRNKKLFKIDDKLYSNKEYATSLKIIVKKYPNVIFTRDSALYYHDLTYVIPSFSYLATERTKTRIKDKNIKQIFIPSKTVELEKIKISL